MKDKLKSGPFFNWNCSIIGPLLEYQIQDKDGSITSMDNKVTYIYDKAGRIIGIFGPNGRELLKDYDAKGNLITEKSKVSEGYYDVKRYTYDLLSRVLTDTMLVEMQDVHFARLNNPVFDKEFGSRLKATVTYEYYANGQIKAKKDANGNETRFNYDLDKHLLEQNEIGIGKQAYKYDLRGNMVEQTNSLNVTTYFDYDNMGRLIRKKAPATDGSMAVNIYIYDANGNLKKSILPNEYKEELDTPTTIMHMPGTSYEYDSMNRRILTISPEDAVLERIKYNTLGKAEKVVDGLRLTEDFESSKGTAYVYNGLGRLTQKTDALDNVFKYEYDVLGRLVKETDPKENSTEYKYGSDGTLISKIFADNSKIEYTYDKLGRQTGMKDQRGYTTNYTYTALGKIKTQTDALGGNQEFTYDLNGNIISQKDKRGNTSYFSYDTKNRITEKKTPLELDAAGNVVFATESYVYDSEGNVLRKSASGTASPDSKRETYYSYYPNNLVKTVSTSSGASTTSSYDKNGNVVMVETLKEEGKYNILKYQYDIMNRVIKKITLVDEDSVSAYIPLGGVKDVAFPGMILLISGFSYDILGNKRKEYSPMAFAFAEGSVEREKYAVNYSYDALNRLESISRIFGDTDVFTKYYYDAVGNKERVVNELGNDTKYAYDSMNRLVTQTDSYSNTYSYKYDAAGNKIQETNSKGDSITYTYDELNHLETVIDPYGIVITKNIYDANGNIIKLIDAKGYLSADNDIGRYGILYTYDMANRLVKVVDPEIAELNNPEKYTFKNVYSQFGEKLSSTDALGNITEYEYDSAGRLVKVITQPGEEVSYGYDKAGNKIYMVDGRGKITKYTYGAMNLLKMVTDADNKEISYRYNLNGNIAEVIDRKGNTTKYSYDNRNLLLEKNVAETGDRVSFTYDAAGNRASMNDESGETTYNYDKNNRLLEILKDGSKQIGYTYDTVGNIETVTDFKGFVTTYSYDKANRMKTVSFTGNTTTYSYDKNGNREMVEYQGGVKETYAYDKNNKLLTLINKRPDGSEISKYSYTYYENGLQKTKTDRYGTTEYIYDAAGRVLKVTTPGKTTVYAYDKAGNRLSQNETYTSNQPTGTVDEATGSEIQYILKKSEYVYTNTNQLLKLTEKMLDSNSNVVLEKNTTYFYDDNGNQLNQNSSFIAPHTIKKHQSTKGSAQGDDADEEISALIERTSNTFDGFNRLKKIESVKDGVRTIAEYSYNGDDLRVRKSVKKSDEQYEEKVTNYLYDRQYVILETDAGNAVKARFVKGVNYIARLDVSNNPSYFLYNGHGDVVQTVTATGEVQNQYDYDIWGNPTLTVESYDCGIRYAGEYMDSESGLYYLRARYYDSYTGRFISEDSYWGEDSNPLSLNRYTYGHNDPIQYVDPTGYIAQSVIAGAAIAVITQYAIDVIFNIIENNGFTKECLYNGLSGWGDYSAAISSGALSGLLGNPTAALTKVLTNQLGANGAKIFAGVVMKFVDAAASSVVAEVTNVLTGKKDNFDIGNVLGETLKGTAVNLVGDLATKIPNYKSTSKNNLKNEVGKNYGGAYRNNKELQNEVKESIEFANYVKATTVDKTISAIFTAGNNSIDSGNNDSTSSNNDSTSNTNITDINNGPQISWVPNSPGTAIADASGYYTVRYQDTLGQIAADNDTTVEAIAADNNISDVNFIIPGQTLKIPVNNNTSDTTQSQNYNNDSNYSNNDNYDNVITVDAVVGTAVVGNAKLDGDKTTGYLTDIISGLGGTTNWNEETKTATVIINGNRTTYDLNTISNGIGTASDGTIFKIENDKIQVGIRDVSNTANANVDWIDSGNGKYTVTVTP